MQLKISSPNKVIFEGEVKQIFLPTEIGEVLISPGNNPMVTALKPGIIKFIPKEKVKNNFIFFKDTILISVSKGMAFVDGKVIKIVTAIATTIPNKSQKDLELKKNKLEDKINKLRKKGSLEEIEKSLVLLEKVNADLKLKKLYS